MAKIRMGLHTTDEQESALNLTALAYDRGIDSFQSFDPVGIAIAEDVYLKWWNRYGKVDDDGELCVEVPVLIDVFVLRK